MKKKKKLKDIDTNSNNNNNQQVIYFQFYCIIMKLHDNIDIIIHYTRIQFVFT